MQEYAQPHAVPVRRRGPRCSCCMGWLVLLGGILLALVLLFLVFFPLNQRVTVLLLGLDRRPGEGDMVRADAIMVLTAHPGGPAVGLLSIPRDLYLPIPGQGENRINTAHFYGEIDQAGSGPERTAETIRQNFGVPVDAWVRVDFHGFVALIDAVDGVEVDVPEAVIDYAYPTEDYGVMTIEIPAGLQTMDGERALQYARSRHSSSDFDRAARQQLIVSALAQKLRQPATWVKLPAFYQAFNEAVDTNLSLLEMVQVGLAVVRVGPDGVERVVIDEEMTTPYTTSAGAAVVLPRWEMIYPQVQQLFGVE